MHGMKRLIRKTWFTAWLASGLGLGSAAAAVAAAEPADGSSGDWDRHAESVVWQGFAEGVLAVAKTEQGARLHCGYQRLDAEIDRDVVRFVSAPDGGIRDEFVVQTAGLGRMGQTTANVEAAQAIEVEDNWARVRRPGLREEFTVSEKGIRQDFVLPEAPAGSGEVGVEIEVRGAEVEANGEGMTLTLTASGRRLDYGGLHVADATGRELPARLEVLAPDRYAIRVDDAAAAYPIRIDPYFSDANWTAMKGGMNDNVQALAVSGPNLYAAGKFGTAGGVSASKIAKWNGSSWSALGSGLSGGNTYRLAVFSSNVYVAGNYTVAGGVVTNGIACWDGIRWKSLGSGISGTPVSALTVDSSGNVYVGGMIGTAGGIAVGRVAKWNPHTQTWSAMGGGLNQHVRCLAAYGSTVYAGGDFGGEIGGGAMKRVAKWNGSSWTNMGDGLGSSINDRVYALAVNGNGSVVYAGGNFTLSGTNPVSRVAKWDGSKWTSMGTGLQGDVTALAVNGSIVYAGGSFTNVGPRLAQWNGSSWIAMGSGMDGYVNALAVSGSVVYAGGEFVAGMGKTLNYVAKGAGIDPPPAPALKAASSIGPGSFTVNWTAAAGATNYYLFVSTTNTFASYVPGYSTRSVGNATSCSVTGLSASTPYYYRLRARNVAGYGGYSTISNQWTVTLPPVALDAANVASTSFSANWTPVAGATNYVIYVSPTNTFASYVPGYNGWRTGNVNTHTVTGLAAGTHYYYRLRTLNPGGYSSYSGTIATGTKVLPPTMQPATEVTAHSYRAHWEAATGATNYHLYVWTTNASGSAVYEPGYYPCAPGLVTTHVVTGLQAGTMYKQTVRSVNDGGVSGNSNPYQITWTLPANPTPLAAMATSSTSFNANWEQVTGATNYLLYVWKWVSSWTPVAGYSPVVAGDVGTQAVTGLPAGETYAYRVKAQNPSGYSDYPAFISVTLLPNPPVAQAATAVIPGSFVANWSASGGATNYWLDVSPTADFASFLAGYHGRAVGTATSCLVTGLTAGCEFHYRVRAENAAGTSADSAPVSVAIQELPVFGPAPAPTARVGSETSFSVSASGAPEPTLALAETTAGSGYAFVPASGTLTYVPPAADVGQQTFTFTASNSFGVATQTVTVSVSSALDVAGVTLDGVDISLGSGEGWTWDGTELVVSGAGPYVLSGSSAVVRVVVPSNAVTALTLQDLCLKLSVPALERGTPLRVSPQASLALTVRGSNDLTTTGQWISALDVMSNATMRIVAASDGVLVARGGSGGGAGIGSDGLSHRKSGTIIVEGGTIVALGGFGGCGIGGGAAEVQIRGGTIQGDFQDSDASSTGPVTITGGSLFSETGDPVPVNALGQHVYPVFFSGLTPGAAPELSGLPDYYGLTGVVADARGLVCVWLPGGTHEIVADGIAQTVWVVDDPAGAPPAFAESMATNEWELSVGEAKRFPIGLAASGTVTVADTDAAPGSFDLGDGFLAYAPGPAEVGARRFVLVASNSYGTASCLKWVRVLAADGAVQPVFPRFAKQAILVGQTVVRTVRAGGQPDPTVTLLSATAAPETYSYEAGSGVLTYVPTLAEAGSRFFTFRADNAAGSATGTVEFSVQAAPAFEPMAGQTVTAGVARTFALAASGAPAPGIDLAATTASAGYEYRVSSRRLRYLAPVADAGEQVFTFQATNSAGTDVLALAITVVPAPVFAPAATCRAWLGAPTSFAVGATGAEPLAVALRETTAAGSCAFDAGAGTLSYEPAVADLGLQTFTFTASNAFGVATQAVAVEVRGARPSFPGESSLSATVGVGQAWTLAADGMPVPELLLRSSTALAGSYAFAAGPGAGNATLSYTPTLAEAGIQQFRIVATNAAGAATQLLSVAVCAAPAFAMETEAVATTGVGRTFATGATGYPAPDQRLLSTTAAGGYDFHADSGVLAYAPLSADAGRRVEFVFGASNALGSAEHALSVQIEDVRPPQFVGDLAGSVIVGETATLAAAAAGTPLPAVRLASTTASGGYAYDGALAALTYCPPPADLGDRTFTLVASNLAGVVTQTVVVSVLPPPVGVQVNGRDVGWRQGDGWQYDGTDLTLDGTGSYVLSGTSAAVRIVVPAGTSNAVVASNLVLDVSALDDACAWQVGAAATVFLSLRGDNSLVAGAEAAGVEVAEGATLAVVAAAPGILAVQGGLAGIRGEGTLEVRDGTLQASGTDTGSFDLAVSAAVFSGGSTWAEVSATPVDGAGRAVHPVTLTGLCPGQPVSFGGSYGDLPAGYGAAGIVTDETGSIRLWLPVGEYAFGVTGLPFEFSVPAGGAVAPAGLVPPSFAAAEGLSVRVGQTVALQPVAWGVPLPDVVLQAATASGTCAFDPLAGVWTYAPAPADVGERAFVFVASNGQGVATQTIVVAVAPAPATGLTIDGTDVSVGAGPGWSFDGEVATVFGTNSYWIEGSSSVVRLSVPGGTTNALVLSEVNISRSFEHPHSPLTVCSNAAVELTLRGSNVLRTARGSAGIEVSAGARLEITGAADGSLYAQGGRNASGIGGGYLQAVGSISISGGNVQASGGWQAAGIGSGHVAHYGPLHFSGGTVRARSQSTAWTLGGGYLSTPDAPLVIVGGSIDALDPKPVPINAQGQELGCVVLTNLAPHAAPAIQGLPAYYGTHDLFADRWGCVYLWLPYGPHEFEVNGEKRAATAVPWARVYADVLKPPVVRAASWLVAAGATNAVDLNAYVDSAVPAALELTAFPAQGAHAFDSASGRLVYCPPAAGTASAEFTFAASNSAGVGSGALAVQIVPAVAPAFLDVGEQVVRAGETLTVALSAIGVERPGVDLVSSSVAAGFSYDSSGGRFTYVPADADVGEQTFVFAASNSAGTATLAVPVTVTAASTETAPYLVVDLSGGPDARSWPVSYLADEPDGGWGEEYRTSKLVLRRIPAGSFWMGSPADELGHSAGEDLREVILTEPYYVGVFELTQRQWELALGTRPSFFAQDEVQATRPVEQVAYDEVRGALAGAGWPLHDDVDEGSLLGALRARAGLRFDLPTEAQWEYAARAGRSSALFNGMDLTAAGACSNLDGLARYAFNSGFAAGECVAEAGTDVGTAAVGSFPPNAWGLYDVLGNVREWCRDRAGLPVAAGVATNPPGASVGAARVLRGGGFRDVAENCRLASRADALPAFGTDAGLRICVPAPVATGLVVDGRDAGLGAGEGWVCDGTTVLFLEDRTYEISGSATGLTLAVAADVSAAIVLRDAVIVADGAGSALSVAAGGSLELILVGSNVLRGDAGQAGLRVGTGAALAISGSGSLQVSGGSAGIGGNAGETSGSIVIRSGTIEASGASGLGTCPDGTCGAVVILGGSVHAIGGIAPGAVNGDSEPLAEVVVDLAQAGQRIEIDGLDGYGVDGIQADENGRIYLYLPNGPHDFSAGGVSYQVENGAAGSVATVNREAILILDVSEPNELGRIILYVDPVHAGLRVAIESAEDRLQTDGSFDWMRLGTYEVEEDGSIHDVPWSSNAEYYRIWGNPD